jgi:hypothetical protein
MKLTNTRSDDLGYRIHQLLKVWALLRISRVKPMKRSFWILSLAVLMPLMTCRADSLSQKLLGTWTADAQTMTAQGSTVLIHLVFLFQPNGWFAFRWIQSAALPINAQGTWTITDDNLALKFTHWDPPAASPVYYFDGATSSEVEFDAAGNMRAFQYNSLHHNIN